MEHSALFTEPCALHALQAYAIHGMGRTAVFDVVVRTMPPGHNFLVAAGLAGVVDYLAGLRFTPDDLDWLEHGAGLPAGFVRSLAGWRFTGDLDALPEGTLFFAGEPVVRISAPLGQAALVESGLVNLLHCPILVASKAVRCVLAADGRSLVDDGSRLVHGVDAALSAARACFLAGYDATAMALAGARFGIPVAGSLAHSFIQACACEEDAFGAFARLPPCSGTDGCAGGRTLPIDNDDVPRALDRIVRLARAVRETGEGRVDAVRFDGGDLAGLARLARGTLDRGGGGDVRIVVGGDLDEYRIAELVAARAPIDVFAVGARVTAPAGAPALDCACSLAEYGGTGRRARATGGVTLPGRKQVFRCRDDDGVIAHDTLGLQQEAVPGTPLLEPVLRGGEPVGPGASLYHLRQALRTHLASLPAALRGVDPAPSLPVLVSPELRALARQVDRRIA